MHISTGTAQDVPILGLPPLPVFLRSLSMSQLPPIPPNIAQFTGPLFLGHILNWGLFGALTVQTYIYYLAFPDDRPRPKIIVALIYVLEVAQTVISTRDSFRNFGTGWGNMVDLDRVGLLWFSVPVLGSLICCIGQLFYAWRIWVLSRQPLVIITISMIALIQLGTGIYSGAEAHIIGVFSQLQVHTFPKTAVWLGSAALNDVIIACCMIFYLQKSNTGFRQTNTIVSKFIRLVIETGFLCAAFAILDLSFYVAFQENNYHLAPSIPLSKLYSNSLLVVLNARVRIMGGRDNTPSTQFSAWHTATSRQTGVRDGGQISQSRKNRSVSVAVSPERHGDHAVHIPMGDVTHHISKHHRASDSMEGGLVLGDNLNKSKDSVC